MARDAANEDSGDRRRSPDASSDAEVPIPREPFDDPGPDARPSDDPEAENWEDDPGLDPTAACCEPLGPPSDIPIPGYALGGVAIAWNGDGWGVLYSGIGPGTAFQALNRDGQPIGSLQRYEPTAVGARLEWADGRFAAAVVSEGDGPQDTVFALLDRRGVVDAGWTDLELPGLGAQIARVSHNDRWVLVQGRDSLVPIAAREVTSDAAIAGRLEFGPNHNGTALPVGLKSRVVVLHAGATGAFATTLTVPLGEPESTLLDIPANDRFQAATRLRDRAVALGGQSNSHTFVSVNPFIRDVIVRTSDLADPTPRTAHSAAGVDIPGVVAACYSVGHAEQTVELRVFGADGQEAAGPVQVSDTSDPGAQWGCAVGSDGERIFVAWQVQRERLIRVRGYRLRR